MYLDGMTPNPGFYKITASKTGLKTTIQLISCHLAKAIKLFRISRWFSKNR